MYYEIGERLNKKIKLHGFEFGLEIEKFEEGAKITLISKFNEVIAFENVTDEYEGIASAQDYLEHEALDWIMNNTDESDRIMNRVMMW